MLAQAFFLVTLVSTVLAATFKSPVIESRGTHAVGFAANPSINAKGIFQAVARGKTVMATFPSGPGTGNNVKIIKQNIPGVSDVISFVADMDVDCDGVFVRPFVIPSPV
jgi:hypothetical protein